ncbi:TPA: hypothetical protein TXL57_000361 [Streptococcus suis]|nr:hypothetical protein [Streptococcus suis]
MLGKGDLTFDKMSNKQLEELKEAEEKVVGIVKEVGNLEKLDDDFITYLGKF